MAGTNNLRKYMNIQSDPTSISVLLIDDDVSLCEMLADYLNNEGLTV